MSPTPPSAPRDLASGTIRISRHIVRNDGYGDVYKGAFLDSGMPVAIKVPREPYKQRVHEEAALLLKVGGEQNRIPHLYGTYFVDPQIHSLALEWIQGKTLEQRLKDGPPLTAAEIDLILFDVLKAIRVLHSAGYAHLRIAPGSIVLDGFYDESNFFIRRVYLTSCGWAQQIGQEIVLPDDEPGSTYSKESQACLSRGCRKDRPSDRKLASARDDLESLGLVIWILAGAGVKNQENLDFFEFNDHLRSKYNLPPGSISKTAASDDPEQETYRERLSAVDTRFRDAAKRNWGLTPRHQAAFNALVVSWSDGFNAEYWRNQFIPDPRCTPSSGLTNTPREVVEPVAATPRNTGRDGTRNSQGEPKTMHSADLVAYPVNPGGALKSANAAGSGMTATIPPSLSKSGNGRLTIAMLSFLCLISAILAVRFSLTPVDSSAVAPATSSASAPLVPDINATASAPSTTPSVEKLPPSIPSASAAPSVTARTSPKPSAAPATSTITPPQTSAAPSPSVSPASTLFDYPPRRLP